MSPLSFELAQDPKFYSTLQVKLLVILRSRSVHNYSAFKIPWLKVVSSHSGTSEKCPRLVGTFSS